MGGRSTVATPGSSAAPGSLARPAFSHGRGPLAPTRRLLALTLGDERFALDIGVVREVLDFGELTRIPRMPRYVRGVVNLRGAAVPVVDLRTRLGVGTVERTVHSRIVIVEVPVPAEAGGGITLVGALADAVREVIEIDAAAVESPPRMGTSVPADVLDGIFRHEGRHVLLLDADRLFDEDAPAPAQQGQADTHIPALGARGDNAAVTVPSDAVPRSGGGA